MNHLCDATAGNTYYNKTTNNHEKCCDDLWNFYWNSTNWRLGSDNQGSLYFSNEWFGPLESELFYSKCGANSGSDTSGEDPAAVFGDFTSSMIDFDTRNRNFQEIFTNLHKYWVAYTDIDGYRMDAVKHVSADFVEYFSTNIRDYALNTLNKTNFFINGEVAASSHWEARRLGVMECNIYDPLNDCGNVPKLAQYEMSELQSIYLNNNYAKYPGLTSIYDFAASGTARDVFLDNNGRVPSDISSYFSSDDYNTVAGQNDYRYSWTLMEIHDWDRLLNSYPNEWYRSILGAAYLMTVPGMPIIYYGYEQGFNGVCNNLDDIDAGDASASIVTLCDENSDDSLKRQGA